MRAPGGTGVVDVVDESVKAFRAAGWVDVDSKTAPKGDVDTSKVPAKSAAKAEWVAYAAAVGIDVDASAKKPDIIEAVLAATADGAPAGGNADASAPADPAAN